ncbi:hypothetical protein BDK51DRAFT_53209, partial [Blyttiomyces helicus]
MLLPQTLAAAFLLSFATSSAADPQQNFAPDPYEVYLAPKPHLVASPQHLGSPFDPSKPPRLAGWRWGSLGPTRQEWVRWAQVREPAAVQYGKSAK